MQANIETISNLERKLSVTVPAEQIEKEVLARLHKLAPKVKLPGFRPGKIPFSMITQKYSDAIRFEVVEDTINSTYTENLKKENLIPAGLPHFDSVSAKPNEPLSYVAVFEIYPEIKFPDLNQVTVEKTVVEINDSDVESVLEKLQKAHGTWKEVEDKAHAAQSGESVEVDYEVTVDEATHESKTDYRVELGAGRNLAEFEKPLFGSKIGDELRFTVPFPTSYFDKKCAGRDGNFVVRVKKILQLEVAALDDEFAKKMGIENGLVGLRAEIRKMITAEMQRLSEGRFKIALMDALLSKYPFDVPKSLIAAEVQRMQNKYQEQKKQKKQKTVELSAEQQQERESFAKKQVASGMLLAEIAKEYKIQVSPEQLRAKITEFAANHQEPQKAIKWYYDDNKRLAQLESYLLEEQLIKHLEKLVSITERSVSYTDAVKLFGNGGLL